LGIVLNLVLTVVLVEYLIRTDQLALILSAAWILIGVVLYFALDRYRSGAEAADEQATGGSEPTPSVAEEGGD
jgi:hypothetical protein